MHPYEATPAPINAINCIDGFTDRYGVALVLVLPCLDSEASSRRRRQEASATPRRVYEAVRGPSVAPRHPPELKASVPFIQGRVEGSDRKSVV